jgi:hypothetical protein
MTSVIISFLLVQCLQFIWYWFTFLNMNNPAPPAYILSVHNCCIILELVIPVSKLLLSCNYSTKFTTTPTKVHEKTYKSDIIASHILYLCFLGPSWSCSYGSWIYDYLCNQCLSSLTLWVRISFRRGVLDTILCDKICQ